MNFNFRTMNSQQFVFRACELTSAYISMCEKACVRVTSRSVRMARVNRVRSYLARTRARFETTAKSYY